MTKVPKNAITLLRIVFKRIFPMVDEEMNYWKRRAEQIPNDELRTQALASIKDKRFHCQGGSVYALLAGEREKKAVRFIVAYQTISDYLDNLCDRSTSLDPKDFRMLHEAMKDALTPMNPMKNYYELRDDQADGGYLAELVQTCQETLRDVASFEQIQNQLLKLQGLYADLQVHKHVQLRERIPRLTSWFEKNKDTNENLSWYEFSAASGSTLGIFCLVSYGLGGKLKSNTAQAIYDGYFPYMQGLHILLDYYIDQQEDRDEGDLNFCSYYEDWNKMKERFLYFIKQTKTDVRGLPDRKFHEMIHQGLIGLYLGDKKVKTIPYSDKMRKALLQAGGVTAKMFNWNIRMYYKAEGKRGEMKDV
nr:tetraprenyl-beta-curcumene synthase family protein [Oceanobacillus profundus]